MMGAMTGSGPGRVFIQPVRKARQKHTGTIAWLGGHMVVCIGYSEDGLNAVFATPEQLDAIKRRVGRQKKTLMYRIFKHVVNSYERKLP